MIAAQDLMVGDWVMLTDPINYGEKVQVKEIHGDGYITVDGGITKMYEPIAITAEILEKNGFVCVQKAYENEQEYECWQFRQGFVQIDYEPQVTMFEVHNGGECNCGVRTINYYTDEDIIYIHQLQHAMRLAGIDITIEL